VSAEALGALLGQLNAVPGVIGSMISGERGQVLAQAFPPQVDAGAPARAAQVLADHAAGLPAIGGPVAMFSMRFGNGRLMVRPVGAGHLLVLCAPTVNPQPLALVAAATAPKLEQLLRPAVPPPLPAPAATPAPVRIARVAPPPQPGRLFQLVQRIEAVIARKKLDPFRTRGAISMAAGVGLRAIDEATPDDPDMQAKLEAAALAVLGERP
jgi:predicted regulator of Ras-like GTPase activity (Roadblock/LC7/MglB family)